MKKVIISLSLIGLIGCANDKTIELEGRVAMKGSSPNTYLSIKDSNSHTSYKIHNLEKFDLIQRQDQTVKLKAIVIKEAIGPDFPAVIEVVEVK
jgi:hypothetical protein